MADITVSSMNGEEKQLAQDCTVGEALAALVSNKIRKQTIAVRIDDTLVDLSSPLAEYNTEKNRLVLEPITVSSPEGQDILRHSCAHVMAQAVKEQFGKEVRVAIGPSIDQGFYYDFDRPQPFTPDDFAIIEKRMQ